MLFASGLIAGAALVGVLIGGAIYLVTRMTGDASAAEAWQVGRAWLEAMPVLASVVGVAAFAGLCWLLWRTADGETE